MSRNDSIEFVINTIKKSFLNINKSCNANLILIVELNKMKECRTGINSDKSCLKDKNEMNEDTNENEDTRRKKEAKKYTLEDINKMLERISKGDLGYIPVVRRNINPPQMLTNEYKKYIGEPTTGYQKGKNGKWVLIEKPLKAEGLKTGTAPNTKGGKRVTRKCKKRKRKTRRRL